MGESRGWGWGSVAVTNSLLLVVAGLLAVIAAAVASAAAGVLVLLAVLGVLAVVGGTLAAAAVTYPRGRRGHHTGGRSHAASHAPPRARARLVAQRLGQQGPRLRARLEPLAARWTRRGRVADAPVAE